MNENQRLEGNVKIPHQVARAGQHARDLLAESNKPPPPAPAPAPAAAEFQIEELLKAPNAEKDADPRYWKERANAVEGFRRQDNAKSLRQIDELKAKVQVLTDQLTQLHKAPPQPAKTPEQTAQDDQAALRDAMRANFTQEEIESFGEERALAITRNFMKQGKSQEAALEKLRGEFEAFKTKQVKDTEKSEQESFAKREARFFEQLTEGFPTWQVVNGDARWLKWMDEIDEGSGLTRQEIVTRHRNALNAGQLIKMLQAFVQSLKPANTPPQPPESPGASDKGGAGAEGGEPEGGVRLEGVRILTDAEMKQGYKRKSIQGPTRMPPEEAAVFDASVALTMKSRGKA